MSAITPLLSETSTPQHKNMRTHAHTVPSTPKDASVKTPQHPAPLLAVADQPPTPIHPHPSLHPSYPTSAPPPPPRQASPGLASWCQGTAAVSWGLTRGLEAVHTSLLPHLQLFSTQSVLGACHRLGSFIWLQTAREKINRPINISS